MKTYEIEYQRWLNSESLTSCEKEELKSIENDEEAKALRFSAPMDFGTAGLRSVMNMGIGSMNRFTVVQTTRGIAALVKVEKAEARGVVIAHDSRNNSRDFAVVAARVLAAAGIKVYIFDDLRPTPELSFTVIELGAIAGINITASHNPKEYNGYKAYWEDGAQLAPEQAEIVSTERAKFDVLDTNGLDNFEKAVSEGRITVLGAEFDEKYIGAVIATAVNPDIISSVSDDFKVVYTPLHGAGAKLVPAVFKRVGLKHLYVVDEQMNPDGNFPTVKKPNPEYADVFELGIKIAKNVGSDLVIATDPDSDRVGVMAKNAEGGFVTISGNQMGALLLDYVIEQRRAKGTLKDSAYCIKSIVSTDMAYKIATEQGVKLYDVLTGFKFIGEVIKNLKDDDAFLLGFEESYGYLLGAYARDKDAVEASMMILEMAAYYKTKNMTLIDALDALYNKYGYYSEKTVDIYMEGLDGIEKRKRVMKSLRDNPPKSFGDVGVVAVGDYIKGEKTKVLDGKTEKLNQPKSDVLYYWLENEDKVVVRPSGTEPKIKIYLLAHGKDSREVSEKLIKYEFDAKRMTES